MMIYCRLASFFLAVTLGRGLPPGYNCPAAPPPPSSAQYLGFLFFPHTKMVGGSLGDPDIVFQSPAFEALETQWKKQEKDK